MSEAPLVAAIEAGGTKMVCAVGRTWGEVARGPHHVVPTTTPEETMDAVMGWLAERHRTVPISSIGVATFGPVDLASASIARSTPKKAWRGFSWRASVDHYLGALPLGLDTDTNAAGLAEQAWGAGRGNDVVTYLTVGTGIGGGVIVAGQPLHGLLHPEMGHMFIPRRPDDEFPGACPSHGDCLEGLAGGPALAQRWPADRAPFAPEHPAWDLESHYLALAVVNVITVVSPQIVIMGGGIMEVTGLIERVRANTRQLLADYLDRDELREGIGDYLVAPGLGSASGVVGAFALGRRAGGASAGEPA